MQAKRQGRFARGCPGNNVKHMTSAYSGEIIGVVFSCRSCFGLICDNRSGSWNGFRRIIRAASEFPLHCRPAVSSSQFRASSVHIPCLSCLSSLHAYDKVGIWGGHHRQQPRDQKPQGRSTQPPLQNQPTITTSCKRTGREGNKREDNGDCHRLPAGNYRGKQDNSKTRF